MPDRRVNLHANVVITGRTGVLILGPSGAGKSSLALSVIEMMRAQRRFAALVADDRIWVEVVNGRLVAEVPQPIAGLVEIRGFGPSLIAHEPRAIVDCVVCLVPKSQALRLAGQDVAETIHGVALPRLDLAEGDAAGAARALLAWLASPLFGDN